MTYQKSESIAALATALSQAQAEMKPAQMNSTNPFLKNRYADLGAVMEAARPVCAKNGLSYSQLVGGDGATVSVTTILMHKSGEWLSSTVSLNMEDEKGKSAAQVAGSIISYLRRYSLASILGIYADEDTDGNGGAPAKSAPKAAQPQPAPTPPAALTYDQACKVQNSEGKSYGDIDSETLVHMANAMANTKPQKPEYKTKQAAIQAILKHRATGAQA